LEAGAQMPSQGEFKRMKEENQYKDKQVEFSNQTTQRLQEGGKNEQKIFFFILPDSKNRIKLPQI
jgi:hypothetical protein